MKPTVLVLGLGLTGRAVTRALTSRGHDVLVVDDAPDATARESADRLGVQIVESPKESDWTSLLAGCGEAVVSPGVPDRHPLFAAAADIGVPILDEYDLAARWDDRPRCAVTGTNGKTTVVTLIVGMLEQAGVRAAAVANTDTPMVAAIDDAETEVFVVEASSFRLAHVRHFSASPAAWLNFSPDHLDVHSDLKSYENAKARIWEGITNPGDAVANMADTVVASHAPQGATGFGLTDSLCRITDGQLVHGADMVIDVASMPRSLPHDLLNAQAATAVALRCGADLDACATTLAGFRGLAHRMSLIAELDGVRYIDDSKATTPHATLTALAGLPGSVLIAGGRNKGLDLSVLAASRPRCVVAIGEAADEIAEAFAGSVPLQVAESMSAAVAIAGEYAAGGGTVLLSPGCTSFDWYDSYSERGLDFARAVAEMEGAL
ncbi:MAG: UDP-N-acetylmuramoyl-L-alanine--D-glutamate ligase [Acidimicrobiia bacterium]|nr:UDP-N-acetylmuramoyl-L-alanine--D-glutamate ligase [Actinomycetota bacterium]MBL6924050.1 UDP-N-acetylmuramoyl-L-alanine--D-glutamate ligase [Acidimicrobiia bacterium]